MTGTYFQKGFGLKSIIGPQLAQSYSSALVERIRESGHTARAGDLEIRLAREFGFCYGVDRAVEYAYEAREKFPDRRIFLSGEIIHNPDVNGRIERLGIARLPEAEAPEIRYAGLGPGDVVILPAFGLPVAEMEFLKRLGAILVDTTCGSVLNVWKNVRNYARDGFTAVIHGKHYHEETKATASQALVLPGGHYLCVKDRAEAQLVCDFITGRLDRRGLLDRLGHATSQDFDPGEHLAHIGLANQTTMMMSESMEIQEMLREAVRERYGADELPKRFRAFDTICSATQDRQDAVLSLLDQGGLDVMVVIGGYNSSNTQALARICAERLATYHISGAECIDGQVIRHRPTAGGAEMRSEAWLPEGSAVVGLTAGASTPKNVVGAVIERVLAARGLLAGDLQDAR